MIPYSLLPLLFLIACTQTPSDQKAQMQKVTTDSIPSSVTPVALNSIQEDTPTPVFDNVYAFLRSDRFPVDSASINNFSGSWYAYSYAHTYKGFQQFGVVFPFEYIVEDSIGKTNTLRFNSIDEIARWRRTVAPELNTWGLAHSGNPKRLVWEGYSHLLFGAERDVNVPYDLDSNVVLLTYLFPMNKVVYYFQKSDGLWQVFKRTQKVYNQNDLNQISRETFEGFALRFISDTPFRVARVKWPLKNTDISIEDGSSSSYFAKMEGSHLKSDWEDALLMAFNQGNQPDWTERDTMYFRSKDEGGVAFGYVFTKIKKKWTLIECWDGSN